MVAAALGEALRRQAVVPVVELAARPTREAAAEGGAASGPGELFAEPARPYLPGGFGRVLGQVQDTFVVAASDQEVFFFDQHAAHERVIFERLASQLSAGTPPAQTLLFPQPLSLAPAARVLLERCREPLERLGFAFETFGGDTVVLRAVPSVLEGDEPRRLVEAALDELAGAKPGEPVLDRVLAFVACRAAIKAPAPLERPEMERLVAALGATASPFFCPHGRPTMSRIALADVRREVRRVW
jgi:DNA mismatch repair protein MutL